MKCDFRQQILYPDSVSIGARIARVGNSSLHIEHRLVSDQTETVAAEAVSVMVSFDFETQTSCQISPEIRSAIRRLEPLTGADGVNG